MTRATLGVLLLGALVASAAARETVWLSDLLRQAEANTKAAGSKVGVASATAPAALPTVASKLVRFVQTNNRNCAVSDLNTCNPAVPDFFVQSAYTCATDAPDPNAAPTGTLSNYNVEAAVCDFDLDAWNDDCDNFPINLGLSTRAVQTGTLSFSCRINPRECNTALGLEPLIITGIGSTNLVINAVLLSALPPDYLPTQDARCTAFTAAAFVFPPPAKPSPPLCKNCSTVFVPPAARLERGQAYTQAPRANNNILGGLGQVQTAASTNYYGNSRQCFRANAQVTIGTFWVTGSPEFTAGGQLQLVATLPPPSANVPLIDCPVNSPVFTPWELSLEFFTAQDTPVVEDKPEYKPSAYDSTPEYKPSSYEYRRESEYRPEYVRPEYIKK